VKFLAVFALIVAFPFSAFGDRSDRNSVHGTLGFDLGLGSGSGKLENFDGSEANFSAMSFHGRLNLPFLELGPVGLALLPSYTYTGLENSANGEEVEVARMKGFGYGLHLRLFKFYFGYELINMSVSHQHIGATARSLDYEMPLTNVVGGLEIPLTQASLLFEYSQANGKVPAQATGLGQDSPYSEKKYWINLRYNTDFEMGGLFQFLFE
tara:strand:+ start:1557 stop:2186 length:630 start_codon:yes stop_codon:yes gene_type:complete